MSTGKQPEPDIRIIVGKLRENGDPLTALVSIKNLDHLNSNGWQFVAADPEDLQEYLAWLYKREAELS
jgi:hypothetical protein